MNEVSRSTRDPFRNKAGFEKQWRENQMHVSNNCCGDYPDAKVCNPNIMLPADAVKGRHGLPACAVARGTAGVESLWATLNLIISGNNVSTDFAQVVLMLWLLRHNLRTQRTRLGTHDSGHYMIFTTWSITALFKEADLGLSEKELKLCPPPAATKNMNLGVPHHRLSTDLQAKLVRW